MNSSLKLALYVLTLVGTLVFGVQFVRSWRQVDATDAAVTPAPVRAARARAGSSSSNKVEIAKGTNELAASTNAVATTNAIDAAAADAAASDAAAEPPPDSESASEVRRPVVSGRGWSNLLFWGLLSLASVAGLGALIAYDVSQYAGNRATETLFDHDGEGIPDSVDDHVDKAVGDGDYLEAVRILREHVTAHPDALEAQIRIAELYEKDMNNPLAAALEYEDVLTKRMSPEKRGWTCVHLVNLYNRLDKPDQALSWLKRVVTECPGTPAAAKARDRLVAAGIELPDESGTAADDGADDSGSDASSGGLPKGFRRR